MKLPSVYANKIDKVIKNNNKEYLKSLYGINPFKILWAKP